MVQAVQKEEPAVDTWPAAQGLHEVTYDSTENVPCEQGVQAKVRPCTNWPILQTEHDVEAGGEKVPGGQVEHELELKSTLYVSRGQDVQLVCPVSAVKYPGSHGTHAVKFSLPT